MTDVVEIMARAACREACAFYGDPPCEQVGCTDFDCDGPSCSTMVKVLIRALEDAGYRIVHPDKVTEEMAFAVMGRKSDDPYTKNALVIEGWRRFPVVIRAIPRITEEGK